MKIGIDANLLSRWRGGSSVYLQNIVRELERIDSGNQYYLYSQRHFALPFQSPRWRKRVSRRIPFAPGTLWLLTEARSMAARDGVDLFWGPGQALPLGLRRSVSNVLTVHDLVWQRFPETMNSYTHAVYRLFQEKWIRSADRLIAISGSVGNDLESLLHVPSCKIRVVHHGVSREYQPRDPAAAARHVEAKLGISGKYICAVGTVEPRKNLTTLIQAVKILKGRGWGHQCVIAGVKGWKDSKIYASVRQAGLTDQDVRFLGFVADQDMPWLYSGATAFVFPSLYEGFGLPLVEAMACGVPIVASHAPPMPEILQDAALLVPPAGAEEFAGAIARVLAQPELREELAARGLKRAWHFGWDKAARELLDVFEECFRARGKTNPVVQEQISLLERR